MVGVWTGARFNTYMGNSCLQNVTHQFNADNFDHSGLGFVGGASITAGGGEREPISSALNIPPIQTSENGNQGTLVQPSVAGEIGSLAGPGSEWGQAWKDNLRQNWDGYVPINIQGESLPYPDQFLDLDPVYRDAYGLPLLRITYDFHENDYALYRFVAARCREIMEAMNPDRMSFTEELAPYNLHSYQSTHATGGAIMGTDPGNSVTNKFGQVWDAPNVFVTGAALYPQNPGMNPTGTLLALAYLTGDALVERYLREPGNLIRY